MAELMQPKALAQLAGSGSVARVEEEWMRLIEGQTATPAKVAEYQPVIATLAERGKRSEAEALAWAAVETLLPRSTPSDILPMAGALLLAVGDSQELRKEVTEIYRKAKADVEGLDELLAEAGLAGGRPVRRALRTLDVCLTVREGGHLLARDTVEAATIEQIDPTSWMYTVRVNGRLETLGAVHLADRFQPASPDDFYVLRALDPQRLRKQLDDDPAPVLIELCKRHGNSIHAGELAEILLPDLVPEDQWKSWWSKTRSALKKSPHLRLEGRPPYTLVYEEKAIDYTAQFLAEFKRHRDPAARFDLLEKYAREAPARGEVVDREALTTCYGILHEQAAEAIKTKSPSAPLVAAIAWHVGEMAEEQNAHAELFELMKGPVNFGRIALTIRRADLLERVVKALNDAKPRQCRDELLQALPRLPQGYCDRAVEWLVQGGCTHSDLDPAVQRILASPTQHFDALLWLWDGPAFSELVAGVPPLSILSRILRALSDARVSDTLDKETVRTMVQHARSALSARNFERFERALEGIDSGMAVALRNQITHVESLGRAVEDGLLRRVSPHLPKREATEAVPPWQREDVIYTTEAGLARKQDEIEQHVNVKMRENAIAIGAAAEKGDLSENSEYKFALEERDLLRARLAQMNAELQGARVLSPDDVPTDHVGVGTRIVFRRVSDGAIYEITLVGPWESDHEKNRINYKAPLAQTILGKRVGDVLQFDHTGAAGTYEIVELYNGLRELAEEVVS